MAQNASISSDFWIDDYSSNIDPIEKLLFLYLLCSPLGNITGIYQIPIKHMSTDTGIDKDMILKILARFERDKKVIYKDGWIAIKNRIKYIKTDNEKIKISYTNKLAAAPQSIKDFMDLPDTLYIPSDTLSIPYTYPHRDINNNIDDNKNKSIICKKVQKIDEKIENACAIWCKVYKEAHNTQYKITGIDAGILSKLGKEADYEAVVDAFHKSSNWSGTYKASIFAKEFNEIRRKLAVGKNNNAEVPKIQRG